MRFVTIRNSTRNAVIGDRIHIADTSLTRLFGLLGKSHLDTGSGLWIKPSSGVHTFFMTFPIDVIGLDADLTVIKLWSNLVPYRLTSVSTRVRSVIELPSGRIDSSTTQVGDQMQLQ